MAADDDQVKTMEKESVTFTGYGGKVSFVQFDKHMARYMRMKNMDETSVKDFGWIISRSWKVLEG